MIAVVQYVQNASVTIRDIEFSRIQEGLLIYLGICKHDTKHDLEFLVQKLLKLKLIPDPKNNYKFGVSILETTPDVLVVSEITLCVDTRHGSRISFSNAKQPQQALEMYEEFLNAIKPHVRELKTGKFGADMSVKSTNIGPITFVLRSPSSKS